MGRETYIPRGMAQKQDPMLYMFTMYPVFLMLWSNTTCR